MIDVRCNSCQKLIRVPDKHAGKVARCPSCQATFRIPDNPPVIDVAVADDPLLNARLSSSDPFSNPLHDPLQNDPFSASGISNDPFAMPAAPLASTFSQRRNSSSNSSQPNSGKRVPVATKRQRQDRSVDWDMVVGALFASAGIGLVAAIITLILWGVTGVGSFVLALAGIAMGLAAGAIARNPSPIFCAIVALIAAAAFFATKSAMAGFLMLASTTTDMFLDMIETGDTPAHSMAVKDQMLTNNEFFGAEKTYAAQEVAAYFANQDYYPPDDESWEAQDSTDEKVEAKLKLMTPEEKRLLLETCKAKYPEWFVEDHFYVACVHAMLHEGELTNEDLAAHARWTIASQTEYELPYERQISPDELDKRDRDLRALAGKKKATLDPAQLDEALRGAIAENLTWTPLVHDYEAVLDQMVADNQFQGSVAQYARATVEADLDDDYPDYFESLNDNDYERLSGELQVSVNKVLITKNQDERNELIEATKQRHPDWSGNDDTDEFVAEVNQFAEDLGDGTFVGSLWAASSWLDFIWLPVAVIGAFFASYHLGIRLD